MRTNLTKKDLINSVYMQIGFSKNITENILGDIIDLILLSLKDNNKVKISKFGTFTVRKKNQRLGRNPKTKEEKTISNRKVVLFKASNSFKNLINLTKDE